ncbi:MAG: MOSC domain-containing protein [Cognatishimia sp.]|uniref:MOSC domain-containing protein n=1 Tax=Cognatishimia sp. TaxID=2211648 RepID=UPI004057F6BC
MKPTVTSLWRHPIKAHGREEVSEVTLVPGQSMPGDRLWAVAHEAAQLDGSNWVSCRNFTRAAGSPQLMAITCETQAHQLRLSHPDLDDLLFDPNADQAAFLDWVAPLVPEGRARPVKLVEASEQGFTDSSWPSLTLCNQASHTAVEAQLDQDLSIHRWRGNIWLDGLEAWAEFDWLGHDLRLGEAVINVRERTERCMATTANPDTGTRDADTLGALQSFGHKDFSVKVAVIQGGLVRVGDTLDLL